MCSPGRKGRADLTSSPPSSRLAPAVRPESPTSLAGNWTRGLRSLWHLSRHLTARADDNHAAPRRIPLAGRPLSGPELRRSSPGKVNAFATPPTGHPTDGKCPSFTARTTRVSNPVRYPRLRASASVCGSHAASAIGVLRHIYAFHRYMTRSACAAATPARQYRRLGGVEPRIFTAGLPGRLRTL